MNNETIITSHGVNIAPAHPILGYLLWLTRTPYRLYQASERPCTIGQWTPVNLIVVDEGYIIMDEPKQDTPQAEPQPDIEAAETPTAGENKPTVSAIADVLYADPHARIKELETDLETAWAARDKALKKQAGSEKAAKERADQLKLAEAEIERLKAANAALTAKLKPDPNMQIGIEGDDLGETIAKLQVQVHELQRQLREKQANRAMTTEAPAIRTFNVWSPDAIDPATGQRGRILFEFHTDNKLKPANGDKTRIVPSDHPSPDELAALPIHVQKSIRDNKQAIYVLHTALNRAAYEGMYDD